MSSNIRTTQDEVSKLEVTNIADLISTSKSVAVCLKVLTLSEPRQVRSNRTSRMYLLQEASVADISAKINLTLWNEDVDTLEVGQAYLLTKGYVREYDECMHLLRSREGEFQTRTEHIEKTNETVDMSKPFAGQKPQRKSARTKSGRSFRGTSGREEKGYCSWKGF